MEPASLDPALLPFSTRVKGSWSNCQLGTKKGAVRQ